MSWNHFSNTSAACGQWRSTKLFSLCVQQVCANDLPIQRILAQLQELVCQALPAFVVHTAGGEAERPPAIEQTALASGIAYLLEDVLGSGHGSCASAGPL